MPQAWKTVRVFISSTFRDMHAERDYLVKVVFPELRERMAKRRLHLVDLDLRWGVTEEEAERGKVLEIILEEIDRSRPFFIAMLGERYGSVPDKVPEDTEFVYPWLRDYSGHSLTALEVVHGVLRSPELARRSFFYFRDPQFISKMPENNRADFVAENPEAARKVAVLKEKIRASGRPVMENYPCRWDDREGLIVGLEVFGQRVLEDLWTAICAEYPEEAPEEDPLAVERQMHEAFAEERSHLHVGRVVEAERLTKYVQGTDRRPMVITGESGCGKSAFLASWCRRYAAEHPDDFILAYFIGASPDSTNHYRLLRNMCGELKRRFALKEEVPREDKKLSEALAGMLAAASRGEGAGASFWDRLLHGPPKPMSGRRIVMVLDALNQLLPLEAAHGLGWLLDYIPEKVRLVVSSLEGDCLEVLRRREAEEIALPPLTADEQRQMVQALLGEWGRKLDDRQMAALQAHPSVRTPLYLRVALEELKLFGRFEQLTPRIEALAPDVAGLFDQVLARLEEDHGRELVAEAFALLGCSRHGLSESEMLELLRREAEEEFPRALWARLAREPGAKAYLVQRGELIGFFHPQLAEAVAARYLRRDNKHGKLAEYFGHAPLERRLDEYPFQLQRAEQWHSLAGALSDLDFFEYAWDHGRGYEWVGYWRSLQGKGFEPGPCYQAAVEARIRAEGETQDIARRLNFITSFLYDMGLYQPALPFQERALKIFERALPPDDPNIALSLNNLAVFYMEQGKYGEALPLFQRALAIRERVLGPNHPDVAGSLDPLAVVYMEQGKYGEALPLFQRALAIRERVLPNHRDVAISLNNLAELHRRQGKFAEALPLHQRALAIRERILPPNHPEIAHSLNNVANCYYGQRKFAEALPLYQRSLKIYERALPPNHFDVAISLNNLALLYKEQGKYAEALHLHQRAVKIAEAALGSQHPHTKLFKRNLKDCQDKMR